MLGVLYPRSGELTGVVRASSLVYIACRLTFAALLVAFGTYKLRKWNPGKNEPRELREGEEIETLETLVEVQAVEESAEAPVAVGLVTTVTGGSATLMEAELAVDRFPDKSQGITAVSIADGRGATDGEPGPTTGLHVPRRTHRRIGATPRNYRHPWANPILWRELMTRAYGARPLIVKACYILLFAMGIGEFFQLGAGMENPMQSGLVMIPVGLTILSLTLVNAQGVTALTSERDTGRSICCWSRSSAPRNSSTGSSMGCSTIAKR